MAQVLIENENSFLRAIESGITLFLGAGFSVLAKDANGQTLPVGPILRNELADEFSIQHGNEMQLAILTTIIESTRRNELRAYLNKRYSVHSFDERYQSIDKLNIRSVFTTNVDNLLYHIFEGSSKHFLNDLDIRGATFGDRSAIELVTLHGSVIDPNRPLRFSGSSMATAFRSDPDRWHSLTHRLQKYPTLFWGYSLQDPGTLEALDPSTVRERAHRDKWAIIQPGAHEDESRAYFQALGMQIILSNTEDMLEYLLRLDVTATKQITQPSARNIRALFPKESIPALGTVPPRPITEFFLGAAPSWYDIFHGQIPKTHHFANLMDAIYSGKHVIVHGIPGCGKTTLMMQAASETSSAKHKLVFEYLPIEKVKLVLNRLAGDPAIIFVDDFADSVAAYEQLASATNVQIVAFDRYYNYDIISHRVRYSRPILLDVTDLTDSDVQNIVDVIPSSIKNSNIFKPLLDDENENSIFEVIQANVLGTSLMQRLNSAMRDLTHKDVLLRDLLAMVSYVYQCRTPVSMDMLIAYLHPDVEGYEKVYEMLYSLQQMVNEYTRDLANEDQDYFVPRSTIMANEIMKILPSGILNKVIKRFHSNVTPYVICRYDIFKRRAYDAQIMSRAFDKWEEGMEFYENSFQIDRNPFLRQQGALYLSGKNKHDLAFAWIDEARAMTNGKVFSIVNAHAIILFRANIGFGSNNPEVKRQLKISMDTLSDCYQYDKRKPYHARTFAEQAIAYWNVYHDATANDYLNTALLWLKEEAINAPTDRYVRALLGKIRRILE